MKTRKRKDKTPSVKAIVEAQSDLLSRLLLPGDPAEHCWACGCPKDKCLAIQRAHIKGYAKGGSWEPANFILLCGRCHGEQPDGADREEQLLWLATREPYIAWERREYAVLHEGIDRVLDVLWLPEESLTAWFRAHGVGDDPSIPNRPSLQAMIDEGMDRSASSGLKNRLANIGIVYAREFRAWALENERFSVAA